LRGGKYGDRDDVAIDLLEDVGFERDSFVPYKIASSLPHGYLKRLELARCLALRPDLLILDELFSGMSMSEVASTLPIIERLNSEGLSIIMVEHRLKELFRIANRVIALNFGSKIADGSPREVMEKKGILPILDKLNVKVIDFDELDQKDWVLFKPKKSHWPNGFRIARPILDAECLISTCCLKTHQYGGIFTLSLKLSVGLTPKKLMRELHRSPDQRKMIAEINTAYSPRLIIMDGLEAFVDGGPSTGKKVQAGVS
jgi:ABC-type multidrug transport system ATPase subunit